MEYKHPSGTVLPLVYASQNPDTLEITARFENSDGTLWAQVTSTRRWNHVEVSES